MTSFQPQTGSQVPPQPQGWPSMVPRPQPQVLVVIGDIGVTADQVITPSGVFALADVSIYANDQSHVIRRTPGWAIVLAVVFALFFLIGLLFLLVKEEQISGFVNVTVEAQGRRHASMVPIRSAMARTDIMQRVGYVQTLTANARSRKGWG